MTRSRIILVLFTLALVAGLYFLPKGVVENEERTEVVASEEEHSPDDGHDHSDHEGQEHEETAPEGVPMGDMHKRTLSKKQAQEANSLKENLKSSTNNEKSAKFASSLAALYLEVNHLDSARKYAVMAAEQNPDLAYLKQAGDVYYMAFQHATQEEEVNSLAARVQQYYEKVLKQQPQNMEVKTNLAMTYIPTSNPMKGIMMLREVLQAEPENQEALYNMGVLSLQSGQYGKAAERFEKLVEVNPDYMQAHLYLGVAYMQTGKQQQARKEFETVKALDSDPEVQSIADSYLEQLN